MPFKQRFPTAKFVRTLHDMHVELNWWRAEYSQAAVDWYPLPKSGKYEDREAVLEEAQVQLGHAIATLNGLPRVS